jgi:hypothetical protein
MNANSGFYMQGASDSADIQSAVPNAPYVSLCQKLLAFTFVIDTLGVAKLCHGSLTENFVHPYKIVSSLALSVIIVTHTTGSF